MSNSLTTLVRSIRVTVVVIAMFISTEFRWRNNNTGGGSAQGSTDSPKNVNQYRLTGGSTVNQTIRPEGHSTGVGGRGRTYQNPIPAVPNPTVERTEVSFGINRRFNRSTTEGT
jgi:hypothetical protein